MNVAFLCLGGNMGDRLANLNRAKALIEDEGMQIVAQSNMYETQAWGDEKTPDYYNQCIKVKTELTAEDLMQALLDIEKKMGRIRTENKNEARSVDLDVLLFNNDTVESELITVPHPRLHLRQFVLKPLSEIAGEVIHPVFNKTMHQLLLDCTDTLTAVKIEPHVHLH